MNGSKIHAFLPTSGKFTVAFRLNIQSNTVLFARPEPNKYIQSRLAITRLAITRSVVDPEFLPPGGKWALQLTITL